jgi:hypothetical protein
MGSGAAPVVACRASSRPTRRLARWTRGAALALGVLVAPAARAGFAHPLHTTLTQLSYDASTRVLNVSVRVFADDFSAAVMPGGRAGGDVIPPDSAVLRYLSGRLDLQRASGGAIPLRWCGLRRDGEVLFLCLRATAQPSPAGARLRNTLLSELFVDQVNIVQASYGGARRTLLFTSRDGMKALP